MKQILGPELFVSLFLCIFVLIISALFKKNILNSEKILTDPDLQKQDSSKTELTAPENEVNLSATPNNEAKHNDAIQIYEQNYEKLKTEFLATLSHELKTPLVSIIGYLDLIATEKLGVITDRQKHALDVSLKKTAHLNTLISSILNFARMEAGKLEFDLKPNKIQPMLNDIIESFKPIADKKNVVFETDYEADMGPLLFDNDLIYRVITNLLDNAVKFSYDKTVISVKLSKDKEQLAKIVVENFGPGIPENMLEKVKNKFFQADTSDTRPRGGLGIGLAIAEKILVGHGTKLHIESEVGKKTTFSFYLQFLPEQNNKTKTEG